MTNKVDRGEANVKMPNGLYVALRLPFGNV